MNKGHLTSDQIITISLASLPKVVALSEKVDDDDDDDDDGDDNYDDDDDGDDDDDDDDDDDATNSIMKEPKRSNAQETQRYAFRSPHSLQHT